MGRAIMKKNELIMMARRIASHMVTSRNGLKRALTEQWSGKDLLNSAKDIAKSLNGVFSDFKRLQIEFSTKISYKPTIQGIVGNLKILDGALINYSELEKRYHDNPDVLTTKEKIELATLVGAIKKECMNNRELIRSFGRMNDSNTMQILTDVRRKIGLYIARMDTFTNELRKLNK
jgi:hypothetical protein